MLELDAGEIVADTLYNQLCVFLAGLYRAEQAIAERLRSLAQGMPPWPTIDADKAIPWVEGRTGLALAERQRAALRLALVSKVLVITGGPGVGGAGEGSVRAAHGMPAEGRPPWSTPSCR